MTVLLVNSGEKVLDFELFSGFLFQIHFYTLSPETVLESRRILLQKITKPPPQNLTGFHCYRKDPETAKF